MVHQRMRVMSIVGARPNMMKIAPLLAELRLHKEIEPVLVHTGQHYDYSLSQVSPISCTCRGLITTWKPDQASITYKSQRSCASLASLSEQDRPDMVLVAGDVTPTVACALVAAKEGIPVAHVEVGLRSFDRSMPEELNRIYTVFLSDLLFTTEESANRNLSNQRLDPGEGLLRRKSDD